MVHGNHGSLNRVGTTTRTFCPAGLLIRPPGPAPERPFDQPPAARPIERLIGGQPLPEQFRGAVIALGNFDGVHFGHQAVLARAVQLAHARGVPAIAATFDPHPVSYFRPEARPFRLTTLEQRGRLLRALGIDALMVFEFNGDLANVSPDAFVGEWLRGAGGVVTGGDFKFGRGKAGGTETLGKLALRHGMSCHTVGAVSLDSAIVSSSRIRDALAAGDLATATRLLTRPFTVHTSLEPDREKQRAEGCATGRIDLADYLRPRPGRYLARVRAGNSPVIGGLVTLDEGPVARLEICGPATLRSGKAIAVELLGPSPLSQGT